MAFFLLGFFSRGSLNGLQGVVTGIRQEDSLLPSSMSAGNVDRSLHGLAMLMAQTRRTLNVSIRPEWLKGGWRNGWDHERGSIGRAGEDIDFAI